MKGVYYIFASVLLTALTLPVHPANAQLTPSDISDLIFNFQICQGEYALCAASTCTPTGGTIDVHVSGGGTASFPEASCICPVFNGPAIADINGGNMQGSCKPPGKGQVWSLYFPKTHLPQAINNYSRKPADSAVQMQLCSSNDNVGATFANCFSFACTVDAKRHNGVKTATCRCPLGEGLDGAPVAPATAILTPAGQCNSATCNEHPVGAPYPAADGQAGQCIGTPGQSSIVPDSTQ